MKNTTGNHKWQELIYHLQSLKKFAIACSGGLDSRLLVYAAKSAHVDFKILHIKGPHIPSGEENILASYANILNINIHTFEFNPLSIPEIKSNSKERCYFCKKTIFQFLKNQASAYSLCDGTNTDDLNVYRPGLKALKELNILSPFVHANISKKEIQDFAAQYKLPFYQQKSQACLITRYNYNLIPSEEELKYIDDTENTIEKALQTHFTAIPSFRLRKVSDQGFELHIESPKITQLFEILNNTIPHIPLIFTDNIRGYFDKKII